MAPFSPAPMVPPNTYTNSSKNTIGIPISINVNDGYRCMWRRLRRSIVAESSTAYVSVVITQLLPSWPAP